MNDTSSLWLALGAGLCSWLSVSLGAAFVFTRKSFSRLTMDCLLGGAGGMMLAAAFLGLLMPALEMTGSLGKLASLPPVGGLLLGAAFLLALDRMLPHIHIMQNTLEGPRASWQRCVLLVAAMALHHIPEGLAIGVGYGAAQNTLFASAGSVDLTTALVITLSIMFQNVPEGLIVALALRAEDYSARRSFLWGSLSGLTAPAGALIGAVAASAAASLLPIALAFAAGAMLYVVIEEVVPEANASGNGNAATVSAIIGICLVLVLTTLFD